MELLLKCPVCDSTKFIEYLQCKDHFLSHELFTIQKCENCGLLLTNPRPEANKLGQYYKSNKYISHSNIKKGIINRIYHFVRARNHRKKYNIISARKSPGEILDIGCATGEFLAYFKKRGWKTIGIEPDPVARRFAYEYNQIDVYEEEKLRELGEKRFNVITMWHVLEHVSDLNQRMQELLYLLKDEGLLVIAVPNSECYDADHYKSFWAGYDVPRHLYHFNKTSIIQLFNKHQLYCCEILPMKYDSYYVSILSEKYISGNNNFLKAIWTGYKSNRNAKRNENNYSSLIFLVKKKKSEL